MFVVVEVTVVVVETVIVSVTLEVTVRMTVISAGKANSVEMDVLVRVAVAVIVGTGSVMEDVMDVTRFRIAFEVSVDVHATTSSKSMACGTLFFFWLFGN